IYQQQGDFQEAADVYKRQVAEAAGDPQQMRGPLQSLANVYQQQEDYTGAAAALQQAISAFDASSKPGARLNALSLRQNLASVLQQSGHTEQAEQIYQRMLSDAQNQGVSNYLPALNGYASFLANTKRAAQAEAMLLDFRSNTALEPWQESNL